MSDDYALPPAGSQPPWLCPDYRATRLRAPSQPLVRIPHTPSETTGPRYGPEKLWPGSSDLTRPEGGGGEAQGQRIVVHGRVSDEHDRPVRNALIEVWQANAAGRYRHDGDRHDAPLDPSFHGRGAMVTDEAGRYELLTIEPGAYPWGNHHNAWRPKHIHFSLFGVSQCSRLVTQMYFPGDALQALDPIFQSVPDPDARARLIASLDMEAGRPDYALAYRFDIVLRGPRETPWEAGA